MKLWARLAVEPACGERSVTVGEQRNGLGRITRRGRAARVAVRVASVRLASTPACRGGAASIAVTAVHLSEIDPPPDAEAIDWMLLTSEPVAGFDDAMRIIDIYQRRWVIEEWHRALKQGCRLEHTQLDDADALRRLAAVLGPVAVRLLQLRDAADPDRSPHTADDPAALQRTTPPIWVALVAALAHADPATLTPRRFYLAIARHGGWLGRKHDGRPGWLTVWRGWSKVALMVRGAELMQTNPPPSGCG